MELILLRPLWLLALIPWLWQGWRRRRQPGLLSPAMQAYLLERKSPYRAIVAFSGEHEFDGAKVSEASLNGFPSKDIADKIQDDPYRFLPTLGELDLYLIGEGRHEELWRTLGAHVLGSLLMTFAGLASYQLLGK